MQKPIIVVLIAAIIIIGILILFPRNLRKAGPGSVPPVPPRKEVIAEKNGFSPQTLTIKKGDTVLWINKSGKNVTVNSDSHPTHNLYKFLNKGEFASGSSVQVTFEQEGTFTYHNHLNPSQKGTIVVK